jgi:hypothetical protein
MDIITNIGLGFKLTNSISFGESMFSAGFSHKTVKVDLYVRVNCAYPKRNRHQKDLEDSRGHHTTAGPEWLLGGAGWPHL